MIFPEKYKFLTQNIFEKGDYKIVPIRFEDREEIMKWRNEQMYHLRQATPLTKELQDSYFKTTIASLFEQDKPSQILFSYLKKGELLGYGGLVHINWIDRNAEISFVMKSELEKEQFEKHWTLYLNLLEQAAFTELYLHKIFTYAFNLRPHLYEMLEKNNYINEAILKEHCLFENKYIDVYIHEKRNQFCLREIELKDKEQLFEWAKDPSVRKNALNSESISWENHEKWFDLKLKSNETRIFLLEKGKIPIGQIRVDLNTEKKWVIDYSIDKKYRGYGYGKLILKGLLLELPNIPLKAIVKESNVPSMKVFEKLHFLKKEMVKGELIEYFYN